MKPYYDDGRGVTIWHGQCLDVLPSIGSVDHLISDPPYFRDVYLRASMPKTKVGSGTPARMGTSLAKLAAGDIGDIDDLVAPLAVWMAANVKRWGLLFSDVENAHKWRFELESASMRYVRTGAWVEA